MFYALLLQYFLATGIRRPLSVKRLNSFVKPLMEIVLEIPFFAARRAHEYLIAIRRRFCEDIKIPGEIIIFTKLIAV